MLRNEFIINEYSDTPRKACVRITTVTSIQRTLNLHKRRGNIRSENVMLLTAVSNARREKGRHMKFSRGAHFSSLDVRDA